MTTHFPLSDEELVRQLVPPDELEPNEREDEDELPPVHALGIDLGTGKCCVAGWWNGGARVYPSATEALTTASVTAFDPFSRLFGSEALKQMSDNPENTVMDAKLLLGNNFSGLTPDPYWPFEVVNGGDGEPMVEVTLKGEKKSFRAQELCAMSLANMKRMAQVQLSIPTEEPIKAVVTVPASFNQFQRQATKDAADIAGLELLQLMPKPTAVAVQYAADQFSMATGEADTVVVFSMGAGFCEAAAVSITGMIVEVVTSEGIQLGGRDLDSRIFEQLAADFQTRYGDDLTGNKSAVRRLLAAAQRARHTLTVAEETTIELEALHAGVDFFATVTRGKVETLVEDLLSRCVGLLEGVWARAKARTAEAASGRPPRLLLSGGCCRTPKLQTMLKALLEDGQELCLDLNLEEAGAQGAATLAASLMGCTETTPAALMLFDITSAGLGLSATDGDMSTIVPRGATIPIRQKVDFSTHFNRQPCVLVEVCEGQEAKTKDNGLLMMFELSGIPFLAAGEPRITASFDVDASGVLSLDVRDASTGAANAVAPLVDMRRLSEEQLAASTAAEVSLHGADEVQRFRSAARLDLQLRADAVRAAIRAPFPVARITEEAERRIREDREAAESALEGATACLRAFPLLEVGEYEAALLTLRQATDGIVEPPQDSREADQAVFAMAEVESLSDGLAGQQRGEATREETQAAEQPAVQAAPPAEQNAEEA